jgi:large subunit ribosomal protein L4
MKATVFSQDGTKKKEIDLPESVFGGKINEHLMYLVVKAYQANQRQGTSKTKGRSEVSGGGKKPWRQKGTGRARSGSNTSPVWVRGGKAFGPNPRSYTTTIPGKMRLAALRSAFSARAREEKVMVVDAISCNQPKTAIIANMLKALSVYQKRNLLITSPDQKNVFLAGRNIKNLEIKPLAEINALDVLHKENIIFGAEELLGTLAHKFEKVVSA